MTKITKNIKLMNLRICIFGHTRLSIIDLDPTGRSNQPLHDSLFSIIFTC